MMLVKALPAMPSPIPPESICCLPRLEKADESAKQDTSVDIFFSELCRQMHFASDFSKRLSSAATLYSQHLEAWQSLMTNFGIPRSPRAPPEAGTAKEKDLGCQPEKKRVASVQDAPEAKL